jgi:hypothetical protein
MTETDIIRETRPIVDFEAWRRLDREIFDLRQDGYDISIGKNSDIAYDNPERIVTMYNHLSSLDRQLEARRHELIRNGIGTRGVRSVLSRLSNRHKLDAEVSVQLELMRDDLLFGPSASDSRAWHNQRGRAAALLTIVSAYDLIVPGQEGGIYDTMSGPLDKTVLEYVFDERAPNLKGQSVSEALIWSDMTYKKKPRHAAERSAARRLDRMSEFISAPNSLQFKEIVEYCTDGLGIRARRDEVKQVILDHADHHEQSAQGEEYLMMSFGCGTALPMLEVVLELRKRGINAKLILIDQDALALASAAHLADKMGIGDAIEIHCEQLFSKLGKPLRLDTILAGRTLDVGEDSGLREYLPESIYKMLTRETWKNLKSGGLMTTGNMNKNRPQAEFLHGMMGWQPHVQMRSIKEGLSLHEAAGISRGKTKVRLTRDGVYSLYFSYK